MVYPIKDRDQHILEWWVILIIQDVDSYKFWKIDQKKEEK